jgi:3-hydroxypropanoate dehydrogenase
MKNPLEPSSLDQIFGKAHTAHAFEEHDVSDSTIRAIYDQMKWGPTAFNVQPIRLVFLRSPQAKARLIPALMSGNVKQVQSASVTAIVAFDSRFHEHLPRIFPVYDAKPLFDRDPALTAETAFRNGTLQGGYLIAAIRAMGLDCGPMSGFDPARVNAEFFPDGRYRVNFLLNIGVARAEGIHPRQPRFEFDEVASIL